MIRCSCGQPVFFALENVLDNWSDTSDRVLVCQQCIAHTLMNRLEATGKTIAITAVARTVDRRN